MAACFCRPPFVLQKRGAWFAPPFLFFINIYPKLLAAFGAGKKGEPHFGRQKSVFCIKAQKRCTGGFAGKNVV